MKKLKGKEFIQQGDTLYFVAEEVPATCIVLKTNVIQEGEATGHAHRLVEGDFQILEEPKTKERFLRLVTPGLLKHEEHHEIKLPPGNYRIGIVREYDHFSEEARRVAD
jgi:hypothetical protein